MVIENRALHSGVKLTQHSHHLSGQAVLGELGEADDIDKHHRHILVPHGAERLVAMRELVDDVGWEVAR